MDDNLFGLIIWLVIIFFWIFTNVIKKKPTPLPRPFPKEQPLPKERTYPEETEVEPEPELKDLFETLGIPFPKPKIEPKIEPKIIPAPEQILEKPRIEEPAILEKKEESVVKKEEFIFSQDKLQEGIILSIILGPPKAYRLLTSSRITTAK